MALGWACSGREARTSMLGRQVVQVAAGKAVPFVAKETMRSMGVEEVARGVEALLTARVDEMKERRCPMGCTMRVDRQEGRSGFTVIASFALGDWEADKMAVLTAE